MVIKKVLAILICFFSTVKMVAQAKKPTIMVVPSDRYCISKGYFKEVKVYDGTMRLPDYKKALQSDEPLRLVISQMGAVMVERGFPLEDLESVLKKLDNEDVEVSSITGVKGAEIVENPIDILNRTAKSDIVIDLDFSVKEADLGMHYINFNMKGVDAYSSKIISTASGSGKPYMTEQVELLLQMAVKDHMDNFNAQLSTYFEDMFKNGREITVQLRMFDSAGITFYDEYDYLRYGMKDELSYILEEFFARNTVEGRFSVSNVTESVMKFSQVRMPLFNDRNRAMDARRYIRKLQKILKGEPFSLDSKIYSKGLGEVWLILGDK